MLKVWYWESKVIEKVKKLWKKWKSQEESQQKSQKSQKSRKKSHEEKAKCQKKIHCLNQKRNNTYKVYQKKASQSKLRNYKISI